MDPEIKKIIEKQIENAPEEIRRLLESPDFTEKILNIGRKYNLVGEKLEIFQTETMLVILGLVLPEEYPKELREHLGAGEADMDNIILDVNKEIFNDIREKLEELYKKTGTKEAQNEDELDERFNKVPEDIRKIIVETNYHENLYKIAKANNITVELMGVLERITTDVVTGVIPAEKLEEKIKNKLALESEEAKKIASEINEQILRPIRQKMEATYSKPKDETNATDDTIEEDAIFKQAGIKIIRPKKINIPKTNKATINAMELKEGDKEIDQKMQTITPEDDKERDEPVPKNIKKSILEHKLGNTVKNPTVVTDHSLNNMSSSNKQVKRGSAPVVDPYREIPE